MSLYHLRSGPLGRLLKYFKTLLARGVRNALEPDSDRTQDEEIELLHSLCMVWPNGPYAYQFYSSRVRNLAIASMAAREVRMAIESSVIFDCELSLEHIEMLRRIEARLASKSQGRLSARSRLVMAVLARVRPAILSIQALLPLRSRPG